MLHLPCPAFLGPSWLVPHVQEPWIGESPGGVTLRKLTAGNTRC